MFRRRTTASTNPPPSAASSAADGKDRIIRARTTLHARSSVFALDANTRSSVGKGCDAPPVPSSPVLIQRLIILHEGLMPLSSSSRSSSSSSRHNGNNGNQQQQQQQQRRRNPTAMLSEDASLNEHGEFILYYYDHSLQFSLDGEPRRGQKKQQQQQAQPQAAPLRRTSTAGSEASGGGGEKPPPDYATQEAVSFAGICRALRSLPLVLQREDQHDSGGSHSSSSEQMDDETEVVHLKDSTLVFIPLELGGDIVAIAQIPRAETPTQTGSTTASDSERLLAAKGYGADPAAVKEAVRRIHVTFSLLLGGGIHQRLLRTKQLESSKDWVLEVIADDDERGSLSDSDHGLKQSNLKLKGDSVWEMADDESGQVELATLMEQLDRSEIERKEDEPEVGDELSSSERGWSSTQPPKPRPRRKPRRLLKQLSQSSEHSSDASEKKNSIKGNITTSNSNTGDYRYGGMEELFSLRKEHRKLSIKLKDDEKDQDITYGGLSRWGSSSNAEDLFNDIANDFGHHDCERRLENLLKLLPITKLREDLVNFYDDNLCRLQGVCEIMSGGVGRCVVDMIPTPIYRGLGSSSNEPARGQHPPSTPLAFVCLAASELMKSLMEEVNPQPNDTHPRLFGMSLFYEDRLVTSQVRPLNSGNGGKSCNLPPEVSYMIIDCLRSSQRKLHEKESHANTATEKANQSADDSPVKWIWGGKNTSFDEEKLPQASDKKGNPSLPDAGPGFMVNPSMSAGGNSPSDSIYIRKLKRHVWLPRVHLPCSTGFNTAGGNDEAETHVALFESPELSFLIFFEMATTKGEEGSLARMAEEMQVYEGQKRNGGGKVRINNDTRDFADLLRFTSDRLMEFCNDYSSRDADSSSENLAPIKEIESDSLFPGELGLDIIYVDRDESSFMLMSQHDLSSNDFTRVSKSDGASSPQNGTKANSWFGIGQKSKESSEEDTSSRSSKYINMLDCRHKLAAYLPLDVMLAFDDMFNEIGRLSGRHNDSLAIDGTRSQIHAKENVVGLTKSIELCTFLPQGWVYSRAFGNVELYILLDTGRFVTINDVQKAVTRVRERLINDKIR